MVFSVLVLVVFGYKYIHIGSLFDFLRRMAGRFATSCEWPCFFFFFHPIPQRGLVFFLCLLLRRAGRKTFCSVPVWDGAVWGAVWRAADCKSCSNVKLRHPLEDQVPSTCLGWCMVTPFFAGMLLTSMLALKPPGNSLAAFWLGLSVCVRRRSACGVRACLFVVGIILLGGREGNKKHSFEKGPPILAGALVWQVRVALSTRNASMTLVIVFRCLSPVPSLVIERHPGGKTWDGEAFCNLYFSGYPYPFLHAFRWKTMLWVSLFTDTPTCTCLRRRNTS